MISSRHYIESFSVFYLKYFNNLDKKCFPLAYFKLIIQFGQSDILIGLIGEFTVIYTKLLIQFSSEF